jgi:hypothetical protein
MDPIDQGLLTLREERDHLSIQISLLKDGDDPDPMKLFEMQREMDSIDRRIQKHRAVPDA